MSEQQKEIRSFQAKRLYELGIGEAVGAPTFDAFLEGLPEVPETMLLDDASFPMLTLVDPRVTIKTLCQLGNITTDEWYCSPIARDGEPQGPAHPYWMRAQDGKRYRNISAASFLRLPHHERGIALTALQGVYLYLLDPSVLQDCASTMESRYTLMNFPGSMSCEPFDDSMELSISNGVLFLADNWGDELSSPYMGMASRRL